MSALRFALICLTIIALVPAAFGARQIDSVSPSSASPGDEVTVTGGPFPDDVRVVLGEHAVTPSSRETNRLRFVVPDIPEGTYILGFRDSEGRTGSNMALSIVSAAPQITDIAPRNVDNCDKARRTPITVYGNHFIPGSRILLDGAAIGAEQQDGRLIFTLPATIEGGQHEVVVINPDRKASLPEALQVETQPEIYSVSQGTDQVNSYEVVITGRNFLYSSTLVVDGRQINNLPRLVTAPPQSDHVRYVDCEKLVYVRYPYSRELHDVDLQVVNPDGQESAVMSVAIP